MAIFQISEFDYTYSLTPNIATISSKNITINYGNLTNRSASLRTVGRQRIVDISIGDENTSVGNSIVGTDSVAILPEEDRPTHQWFGVGSIRTTGAWGSATYYPIVISVASNGSLTFSGNKNNMAAGKFINGSLTYIAAQ